MKTLSSIYAEEEVQFRFILDCYKSGLCTYNEGKAALKKLHRDFNKKCDSWLDEFFINLDPEKANKYQSVLYN
jgi:hypothetical protein